MNTLMLLLQEEGPDSSLSWLLLVVLGLFLLIVVAGWWASRRPRIEPEIEHEAHAEPDVPPAQEHSPDDLTRIEGIGPKVASVLNGIGINSFEELANADQARVEQALDEAGLQMMEPEGWIEQAKLAARGDMEGLIRLQDELEGGRRTS